MKIHREQSPAVIQHNAAAGKVKISDEHGAAMIARYDFGSYGRREVSSGMRSARYAVDDPAEAKRRSGGFVRHWSDKWPVPHSTRAGGGKNPRERRLLTANLLERFRSYVIKTRRHIEGFFAKSLGFDLERYLAIALTPTRADRLEDQF